MSCSTIKLKSHILLTCENFMFYEEKNFAPENGGGDGGRGGGRGGAPLSSFLYGSVSL